MYSEGRNDEALKLLTAAAELEDSTDKHPVTPGAIVPAHELLGDLRLELDEPARALEDFEKALAGAPGRFNALYGAARAAQRAGERVKARDYYAKLVSISERAQGERAALAEAKAFLVQSE